MAKLKSTIAPYIFIEAKEDELVQAYAKFTRIDMVS